MKYALGIGSGAVTYIPCIIKIGSGIQKLIGCGGDSQTTWRPHEPSLGKRLKIA
jgi:hypothetical protein